MQAGGDPPGVAPTYYKLRAVEKVVLQPGDDWFEAMQPELFQLERRLQRRRADSSAETEASKLSGVGYRSRRDDVLEARTGALD